MSLPNILRVHFCCPFLSHSRLVRVPLALGKGMRPGHDSRDTLPRGLGSSELPFVPSHPPEGISVPSSKAPSEDALENELRAAASPQPSLSLGLE